jgi:MscS family membrane protein
MIDEVFTWIMYQFPQFTFLENSYLAAIFILIITGIFAWLVLFIFSQYLQKFAAKTETKLDDMIFERTKHPIFYLVLAGGLKLALSYLGVNGFVAIFVNIIMAIVFVFILSRAVDVVIKIWGSLVAHKTNTKLDEILLPLLHKFSKVVFVIVAIMWILSILNINITPYLAGVGISGIVLGLALQSSLKNIFGGVSLIIDGAIKVGDKIRLESGEVGEIIDVGLRSTKIRTYDNEELTVPNGYLADSKVQNYTRPTKKMRVWVAFGVEYGADAKKVSSLLEKELKMLSGIMKDPAPKVQFLSMGDFALEFKAYIWVDSWKDAYTLKLEATQLIYDTLNKKKIGIPYPTQTVILEKVK